METPNQREKRNADELDLAPNARAQANRRAEREWAAEERERQIEAALRAKRATQPTAPPLIAPETPARNVPQPKRAAPAKPYAGEIMASAVQRSAERQPGVNRDQERYLRERSTKAQRVEARVLEAERPAVQPKLFTKAPERVTGMLEASVARAEQRVAPAVATPAKTVQRQQRMRRDEEPFETLIVPVMESQLGIVASVIVCIVLATSLFTTPLGAQIGTYSGPATWGAWASSMGEVVRSTIDGETAPVIEPKRLPMAAPIGESSIVGPPTITATEIDTILASYGSPAVGAGRDFHDLGLQYGIDPAYAVAFFIHESSAGTNPGWAGWKPDGTSTHNVGNIICAGYPTCYNRFRDYASWAEGIEDWYKLLDREYINGRGTYTVEQIIPIYAPSFENNVPGYINAVNTLVANWREGRIP